jgi:hypothetical protein
LQDEQLGEAAALSEQAGSAAAWEAQPAQGAQAESSAGASRVAPPASPAPQAVACYELYFEDLAANASADEREIRGIARRHSGAVSSVSRNGESVIWSISASGSDAEKIVEGIRVALGEKSISLDVAELAATESAARDAAGGGKYSAISLTLHFAPPAS